MSFFLWIEKKRKKCTHTTQWNQQKEKHRRDIYIYIEKWVGGKDITMGKLMLELITNSCVVFFGYFFLFSISVVRRFVSACYSLLDVCYFCQNRFAQNEHIRTQTYTYTCAQTQALKKWNKWQTSCVCVLSK